jgi:hypothetical protein
LPIPLGQGDGQGQVGRQFTIDLGAAADRQFNSAAVDPSHAGGVFRPATIEKHDFGASLGPHHIDEMMTLAAVKHRLIAVNLWYKESLAHDRLSVELLTILPITEEPRNRPPRLVSAEIGSEKPGSFRSPVFQPY